MPKFDVTKLNVAIEKLLETATDPGKLLAPFIKPLPSFDEFVLAKKAGASA